MDRTTFLLKLATQRKFAYKSEDLISSTSTSTCSENSLPPSPEKKHIVNAESKESSEKKIIIHSNGSIPETSQATSTFGSELATISIEKVQGVKLPEFSTINSKIVSQRINDGGSSFCENSLDNDMLREISSVPVNVSENTIFQKLSDASESFQSRLDLDNVSKMDLISIKTNIQDGACENLEYTVLKNADLIKTSVTKSNIYLNDSLEHLVPIFDDSDLEEGKTPFEDFTSSGSEYIPSNYSSSSTSDMDESEIFDVMKAEKTYSKRNPTEQSFGDSPGLVTKNEESLKKLSKISGKECSGNVSSILILKDRLETIPDSKKKYVRSSAARERPTLCPICYQDVITHFPRHLFRHHGDHKDVKLIKSLKAGSSERLALISALRKQGYFHLTAEKDVVNPVRSSKDPNTKYFVCTFCLGHYSKHLLYKHVKICRNKPVDIKNAGKSCLSKSQSFMASVMSKNQEYLKTSRLKNEVFDIMRADNISKVAKNDPLICLYGESLLARHKRQQIANVVSNKVREMARMLITVKSMDNEINTFFDILRPEMFGTLISAAKNISGYDINNKSFKAPSLALHMGTNLKFMCNVAFKIVMEKRNLPTIKYDDRDKKKNEIKDLKKLIEGHWCNEISSLALKTLKERQWESPVQLPLASDILLFQTYVNDLASAAYEGLRNQIDLRKNYRILTECVLAYTVMFNRKRVGDVQYLKIETYKRENHRIDQEAFTDSLTKAEKILSNKFKRVVTDGKGSKPVPILFSPKIQKYVASLLDIRRTSSVVPISNPYLFANPNSVDKWMTGTKVIRCLAENCGAKQPKLLTSTKFRKHIATTLQLMSMESDEIEQVAKFMGHTRKTHCEFYRLPQDIYETAKVAKVLLLLEKGRGTEFRGKSLSEIELNNDIYYSSESEEASIGNTENEQLKKGKKRKTLVLDNETENDELKYAKNIRSSSSGKISGRNNHEESLIADTSNSNKIEKKQEESIITKSLECENNGAEKDQKREENIYPMEKSETNEEDVDPRMKLFNKSLKKIQGRVRWTNEEKVIVRIYFDNHVKKKITPRKYECDEFMKKHGKSVIGKDWVKIKTFVYNCFRQT